MLRKILTTVAVLLLAVPLYAQVILPFTRGVPSPGLMTADDTDIALLIKYVGTQVGKVQVSSGDLVFTSGAAGATADTEVNSAAFCGASVGTIDVDDTDCNTVLEVIDTINKTTSWRAVPVDAILPDSLAGARLLTLAATFATGEDGLAINWDTSAAFDATRCLNCPRSMRGYIQGGSGFSAGLTPNPLGGYQTVVFYFDETSTYGSGTSTAKIISARSTFRATGSAETYVAGAGADGTIYQLAGGATTANKVIYNSAYGILCAYDSRCLVRIDNSAAAASVLIQAYGVTFPYVGP